jgi:hypothetical protein
MCRKFVLSHFPTKRNIKADTLLTLKNHATESVPGRASTDAGLVHSGVDVPECIEMREQLLQRVSDLNLPPHFLDGMPLQVATELVFAEARISYSMNEVPR